MFHAWPTNSELLQKKLPVLGKMFDDLAQHPNWKDNLGDESATTTAIMAILHGIVEQCGRGAQMPVVKLLKRL